MLEEYTVSTMLFLAKKRKSALETRIKLTIPQQSAKREAAFFKTKDERKRFIVIKPREIIRISFTDSLLSVIPETLKLPKRKTVNIRINTRHCVLSKLMCRFPRKYL